MQRDEEDAGQYRQYCRSSKKRRPQLWRHMRTWLLAVPVVDDAAPLGEVALTAEHLQIARVQAQAGIQRAGLDVVDMEFGVGRTACRTPATLLAQRRAAKGVPFLRAVKRGPFRE